MENVLVLLHDDGGQESRFQAALDLTRAVSGHLIGLDVTVPPTGGAGLDGIGDTMVLQAVIESESENRVRMRQRLASEDVSWSMREAIGWPAGELRSAADLADIVVVSGDGGPNSPINAKHLVNEVVMKGRRPVLVVPTECTGIDFTKPALIAWDGSAGISEGLRATVPLLSLAASVTILEVNGGGDGPSTTDAASYLSRHDIHAQVVEMDSTDEVSQAILEQARAIGAGYIVMGSFGRGRMLETIFGGATAALLHESKIPLIVAH